MHDLIAGSIVSSVENAKLHAWHPSEPLLAMSFKEHGVKQLMVCSAPSGKVLLNVLGHFNGFVRGDRWSPCGQWLACNHRSVGAVETSPARARRIRILCARTGHIQSQSQLCDNMHHMTLSVKFTLSGHMAVISKEVYHAPLEFEIIDVTQGSIMSQFIRPFSGHTLLGFCPRGYFIAISDTFGNVTLYNASSGRQHASWHLPSMAGSQEAQEFVSMHHEGQQYAQLSDGFWSSQGRYMMTCTQMGSVCKAYLIQLA